MRTIVSWLSLSIIFVIPWENMLNIGGLGTISAFVGLFVGGLWAFTVLIDRKIRSISAFHFVFILFILWNISSIYWTIDFARSMSRIQSYVQIGILVYLLWDLYKTSNDLERIMQTYILGAYVSIFSLLMNFGSAGQVKATRFSTEGFNANDLGMILVLGMPLAWYLVMSGSGKARNVIFKILNICYIPAALLAITLTGSRSSFLSVIPVLIFILASFGQIKIYWRVLIFIVLVGSSVALLPMIPESTLNRLAQTTVEVKDGDWNGRLYIWREGISIIADNPLAGVGTGAFKTAAVATKKNAHNFAISIFAELGIIGFSLFAILLAIVIYLAMKQQKWKTKLWLTVLAIWFLGAITHNWENRKQTWLFMSMIVISAYVPLNYNGRITGDQRPDVAIAGK